MAAAVPISEDQRRNRLENSAKEAYYTFAHRVSRTEAWERLSPTEWAAWKEVVEYLQDDELQFCSIHDEPLICPTCDLLGYDICPFCKENMVCPNCDREDEEGEADADPS